MKTIGIIGAMEEEITLIKESLEIISVQNIIGLDFFIGKIASNNVIIVKSGIGKVNAAICTQILINLYAVDCVINIGVAGAIDNKLKIGDTVISDDAMYHDFDTTIFGNKQGVIPRMSESVFKADKKLVELAINAAQKETKGKVLNGRIVSGDKFISNVKQKIEIRENFCAACVEMEGAAIAHTCYLNKIPFVIIRTISDTADEGNTNNYQDFFKNSARISNNIIRNMLDNI